jgi:acetyl-CoA synthetase
LIWCKARCSAPEHPACGLPQASGAARLPKLGGIFFNAVEPSAMSDNAATQAFLQARQFLQDHREDYATAYAGFRWPALDRFNWALDYFDVMARGNEAPALWIVEEDGREEKLSFAQLSQRSSQAANWLRPGRAARRPRAADAGQRAPAVGGDAGPDQAGRGDDPGHHAAGGR